MAGVPSASYSMTARLEIRNRPGMLGRVTSAIGKKGGDIGAIDVVEAGKTTLTRDITFKARDESHGDQVIRHLRSVPGVRIIHVSDRTFLMHLGGKIEIKGRVPLKTRDDLSMAYTPGVARVCTAIQKDPEKAYALTIKKNSVAVVTDGTAVLGLGDIGPKAALPVMEGKVLLFKELAGVDAYPICLDTKDPEKIVEIVEAVSPGFGGINLEDISAPRCFFIEETLRKKLDLPVFHDDQHGTAVVVLAALINALKIVKKKLREVKVVVSGAGASGIGTARLLLQAGVRDIILCDRSGAIHEGRKAGMNTAKAWCARHMNPRGVKGPVGTALARADVFVGLSGPGAVSVRDVKRMARDAVVFSMSNPAPEIMPEEAARHARVIATGRSDYPNQINNVLCFPGLFRGLLDVRARLVNDAMKIAAARGIASIVSRSELSEEYIIPSVFDKRVVEVVAAEVARAAFETGAAKRRRKTSTLLDPGIWGR
jgi:malate dehydrogenase (oxaloacetate-decarboxylating)